ncbi:hypothetical protein ACQ4LE_000372 [Meloidogyne hapla]
MCRYLLIFLVFSTSWPIYVTNPVAIAGSTLNIIKNYKTLKTMHAVLSGLVGAAGGATVGMLVDAIIDELTKEGYYKISDISLIESLFPLTFIIGGGELLVERSNLNEDYLFDIFERLTERRNLKQICFYTKEGILKELHKSPRNMPLFLLYALMNEKKLDLFLCS